MRLTLTHPVLITPRLWAGVQIGNGWISIEYAGQEGHRIRYRWAIDAPGIENEGDDLTTGRGGLQEALAALLGFLLAYTERNLDQEPENLEDLGGFSWMALRWAKRHRSEIEAVSLDLEETENLILEGKQ